MSDDSLAVPGQARDLPLLSRAGSAAAESFACCTAMDNDDIIHTLNGLLALCRRSERTVRRWGGKTSQPGLHGLCERIAVQRAAAAADLQRMVVQSGGTPDKDDVPTPSGPAITVSGWAGHGAWLGALQACEQIENAALELYGEALDEPLPALVRLQLERQQRAVEDNHRLLQRLRLQAARDCPV